MKITINSHLGNFPLDLNDEESHMVLLYATTGTRSLDNPELVRIREIYETKIANKWLVYAGLPPVEEGMEEINALCERERNPNSL